MNADERRFVHRPAFFRVELRLKQVGMTPREILLQSIDTAFDKKSWHGTTLDGAIRRVDASTAAKQFQGRKTVWEQLLHAAYWKHRILCKIAGERKFPRKGSDWIAMPPTRDERTWRADIEMLRQVHRDLRAAVVALPEKRLDQKTVWLIHGAAAHDLYHAGQIKLMLRLINE
jgi:uncharacterized damage-inducible protein DinB